MQSRLCRSVIAVDALGRGMPVCINIAAALSLACLFANCSCECTFHKYMCPVVVLMLLLLLHLLPLECGVDDDDAVVSLMTWPEYS